MEMKHFLTVTVYTLALMLFIHGCFQQSDAKVLAVYVIVVYALIYVGAYAHQKKKTDDSEL